MFDAMEKVQQRLMFTAHPTIGYWADRNFSNIQLMGIYRDHAVVLERHTLLQCFSTRVMLKDALATPCRITCEGFVGKLGKLLGASQSSVGDARFDEAFHVRTDDLAAVVAWLTPQARDALFALRAHHDGFTLSESYVEVERHFLMGEPWTEEQVTRDLDPAVALAEVLAP